MERHKFEDFEGLPCVGDDIGAGFEVEGRSINFDGRLRVRLDLKESMTGWKEETPLEVFCRNCMNQLKLPGGFDNQPDPICLCDQIAKKMDFVIGCKISNLCKNINTDGRCSHFVRRMNP